MSYADSIKSLANVLADYEVVKVDEERVARWIQQFENFGYNQEIRKIILDELVHIFRNNYLSRKKLKESFEVLLANLNSKIKLENCSFLNLQLQGKSQSDYLLILNEVLNEKYNLSLNNLNGIGNYIYIDDCIYSGNVFKKEMINWIKNEAPNNSRIISSHTFIYKQGLFYAKKAIVKELAPKKLSIAFNCFKSFNNQKIYRNRVTSFDFLYPRYVNDPNVNNFANKTEEELKKYKIKTKVSLFRNDSFLFRESLFSSPRARLLVESSFLRVGAYLIAQCSNPDKNMRPMGFEILKTLGFGSMIATFRNISNNCPLALWYGDPDKYGPNHPLGKWFPLLPRKTWGV